MVGAGWAEEPIIIPTCLLWFFDEEMIRSCSLSLHFFSLLKKDGPFFVSNGSCKFVRTAAWRERYETKACRSVD